MTKKYPIFLNLKDRDILIVGGGLACLEKLQGLENTGALITIITREIHPDVTIYLEGKSHLNIITRDVVSTDLEKRDIIFLATNDPDTNKKFRAIARNLKIWANSVDDPNNCDFYSASLINLGAVSFSISTDGQFAGLTASLRRLFEEVMPKEDTDLMNKIYQMRKLLKEKLPDQNERRNVLKGIVHDLETKYFRST